MGGLTTQTPGAAGTNRATIEIMKSKTHKWYEVRIAGQTTSSFSQSGYSQYYKRLSLRDKGKLRGLVYGIKQARDHVAELRTHVYEGKKIYKDVAFEITHTIQLETVVQTLPA